MNKVKKIFLLSICTAMLSISASAQHVLKQAQEQAELYNYSQACPLFEEAYAKKQTIEAARGAAICYRKMNDCVFAESWYAKVVAMKEHTIEDMLAYAETMMCDSKYVDAKELLELYRNKDNAHTQTIHRMLVSCDSALYWMQHPTTISWENAGSLNSTYNDWGAFSRNNSIVFVSDRTDDTQKKRYGWTGNPFSRLYESSNSGIRQLNPGVIEKQEYNIGKSSFTADGTEIFYDLGQMIKKTSDVKGGIYDINLAVYSVRYSSTTKQWSAPLAFAYNNPLRYSVGDPFISPDGRMLYFIADMPGKTLGGTDIFYCKRLPNNEWSEPQNMGADINTEGNERTPFMAADGTLYFSSDSRIGMGGLDVYKATKTTNGWQVVNMGVPVNSPQDDFAYTCTEDGNVLISSNRLGGHGGDDIYKLLKPIDIKVVQTSGRITNTNGNPTEGVLVTISNTEKGTKLYALTDIDGRYELTLEANTPYTITIAKKDYPTKSIEIKTDYKNFTADFDFEKVPVGVPIRINNIHYSYDKWELRPEAYTELKKLVKLLADNPTYKIELASHTDSRGSSSYNLILSQKRSESVVRYLVSNGISAKRVIAKGYGDTRLINGCAKGVKCPDVLHEENRRTEFTIIDK